MPINVWLPILISACMLLIAALTFARSGTKEKKEVIENDLIKFEGIRESLIELKLSVGQIDRTTQDTRTELKDMNNKMNYLDKEQAKLKTSVDDLKKRVEQLEER